MNLHSFCQICTTCARSGKPTRLQNLHISVECVYVLPEISPARASGRAKDSISTSPFILSKQHSHQHTQCTHTLPLSPLLESHSLSLSFPPSQKLPPSSSSSSLSLVLRPQKLRRGLGSLFLEEKEEEEEAAASRERERVRPSVAASIAAEDSTHTQSERPSSALSPFPPPEKQPTHRVYQPLDRPRS